MDQDRQIRFLIPPMFFVASLLWGLAIDPNKTLADLIPGLDPNSLTTASLLSVLAGGGVVVVALGYFLGTLTISALRLLFQLCDKHHEVVLSDTALEKVWEQLKVPKVMRSREYELFAGVALDHEILRKSNEGIHLWLVRRWNAFNLSATIVTSLTMSLLVSAALGIRWSDTWILPCIGMMALFSWSARTAWRDTMAMAEFQALRLDPKDRNDISDLQEHGKQ